METLINKKYVKNHQKSRQNIKQQLSVLNGIIESINRPIFSVDEDYKYTSFNKAHATVMKLLYNANIELYKNMLELELLTLSRQISKAE